MPLGLGSRGLIGFTPAGPVLPWPACCVSPYATPEQHSPRALQRFGTASGRHWTIRRFPSHPLCSGTLPNGRRGGSLRTAGGHPWRLNFPLRRRHPHPNLPWGPPPGPRQIDGPTRRESRQYQAAAGAAGAERDEGTGVAEHSARVEAQLRGPAAAPGRARLLHLEAAGQEAQVVAKLQVQVAPEGRQVQQQGALAGPDARGGGGRAGAPALSRPGGAGQRLQVHVV